MSAIVVYASRYGNTKRVAAEIAGGIADSSGEPPALRSIDDVEPTTLSGFELIVIGSPDHFGRPIGRVRRFVSKLRLSGPDMPRVAFFDTCLETDLGKAVHQLEAELRRLVPSAEIISPGFSAVVLGIKGPLREGEIERSREFGRAVVTAAQEGHPVSHAEGEVRA